METGSVLRQYVAAPAGGGGCHCVLSWTRIQATTIIQGERDSLDAPGNRDEGRSRVFPIRSRIVPLLAIIGKQV